jgi:hypothetical protein
MFADEALLAHINRALAAGNIRDEDRLPPQPMPNLGRVMFPEPPRTPSEPDEDAQKTPPVGLVQTRTEPKSLADVLSSSTSPDRIRELARLKQAFWERRHREGILGNRVV